MKEVDNMTIDLNNLTALDLRIEQLKERLPIRAQLCDDLATKEEAAYSNLDSSMEEYRAASEAFDSAYALFKEEQEELDRLEEVEEAFKVILQNESLLEKIGL